MALEPPDDLIELPSEVYDQPREPTTPVGPSGLQPPGDLIEPSHVPIAGAPQGWQPPPSAALNDGQKGFLNTTATGRVMKGFGTGFYSAFESDKPYGLSVEADKALREVGMFRKEIGGNPLTDPIRAFNEAMITPAASALELAFRTFAAPVTGLAGGIAQFSEETGIATRSTGGVNQVEDNVIGAIDTMGLLLGVHIPIAGMGGLRRRRIAGKERVMDHQIPDGDAPKAATSPPMSHPIDPPDVIQVPPGGFHVAAETARSEPAAGPALQIGEQRVVFPDDAHTMLFEYGEALSFGDESAPAVRAGLIQKFGEQAAGQIDAAARSYYDRVAAKIESTAGEVVAGRADEPGRPTFTTTPAAIADEHALEVAQIEREGAQAAAAQRPVIGFTTAKGSTYEVGEGGSTTRNKAARSDVGHEGDFGPKTPSDRTIYVDPKDAPALSAAGLQGLGPKGARLVLKDGKASLATWNEQAGQWGVSPSSRDIPFTETPEIGKSPVEGWKRADDVGGLEAYRGQHAGNPITELKRELRLAKREKGYGDNNQIVSTSQADDARALLKANVKRLTSGVDPELIMAGIKLATYHIEAGAREFAAWSKQMISDLGEWARPYLRDWYDKALTAISEFSTSEYGGSLPRSQRMKPAPPVMLGDPRKAGNINLDRINSTEDVLSFLEEVSAAHDDFRTARRGSMTFEDIQNLADSAGFNVREFATNRKVGQILNAEQGTALRNYLVASSEKLQELARTAKGGSDEDVLAFEAAMDRHVILQAAAAGDAAEQGRALGARRIMAAATDKAKAIAEIIAERGGREGINEKIDAIIKLNDPDQISRTVRRIHKPITKGDMIIEAWMNGLLSGPVTHGTNFVSNTIANLANIAEMSLAAGIGAARETVGLGGAERVYLGEAQERLFGIVNGSQEALIAAREAFRDDMAASTATGKLDVRRPGVIPGRAGRIIRTPTRLLSASDAFFQAITKRQETAAIAYRKAKQEGLTGERFAQRIAELTADPTPDMAEEIGKAQTYLTFTKPLGVKGRQLQALLNSSPYFRFFVPFVRTPINIVKYYGERTVFAPFAKEVKANLSGRNGQAAQDKQMARLIMGTAITVSAMYWAQSGYITGSGPTDPRARNELYATGWAPYSFKIGDSYYPYLRYMGPFGVMLGVAADASEIADRTDRVEGAEISKLVFASATTNLLNQTWLQGPADLAQAINEPERYGAQYVSSFTSTVVPSLLAQEARVEDPYLREARGIIDGIKARVPGLRQTLRPQINLWGEPIERDVAVGPDRLSPFLRSPVSDDYISREMLRLGIWKSQPSKTIRGIELDDDQYYRFRQLAGKTTRMWLANVVGIPGWEQAKPSVQAEIINGIFDRSRESARIQFMMSDQGLLKKIIETGIAEITATEPDTFRSIAPPAMPAGAR